MTSKSPLAVIRTALAVAKESLPAYSHVCSPKKFTQHQLFACLVLKSFLRLDYRGLVAHLDDCPSLSEAIELRKVPHYTTFQKASARLLALPVARRLLSTTIRRHLKRRRRVRCAAIDSTGLESSTASPYFVRRRHTRESPWKSMFYHRFPKLTVLCHAESHFILSSRSGRGPMPDVIDFRPVLGEALRILQVDHVLADAGYDSETNHCFARDTCGVRTVIPPKRGRPGSKPALGRYRRLMQTRFDAKAYRQRSQVETVVSMIKRRQGAHVASRTYWAQCRELHLKVLTHNIMILRRSQLFYRAGLVHFSARITRSLPWSHRPKTWT